MHTQAPQLCDLPVVRALRGARARHSGNPAATRAQTPKPQRTGTVFWLENAHKDVLMARRPDKGLLGGMLMFPSQGWDAAMTRNCRNFCPMAGRH